MYIDTHCHLNFSRFTKSLTDEIELARSSGVTQIVIPGTDIPSSHRAVEIAKQFSGMFAAVGIHPHHAYSIPPHESERIIAQLLAELATLIQDTAVVAVGEVGLDKHVYKNTKYEAYAITPEFMEVQLNLLTAQLHLAKTYKKTLILHNRETKKEIINLLEANWSPLFENRSVFHCCEADLELLDFAKSHKMYIGIDGDITYDKAKAEFIIHVPLEMLVLETDSPFLLPEPLKSQKQYPNGPRTIPLIAEKVAQVKGVSIQEVMTTTTSNARRLFSLT